MIVRQNSGFTLLEVMIAMSILAFISIFTTSSIQRALKQKTKIQTSIDRTSQLRDTLQVMMKDINMAFHYHDINVDLYNEAWKERIRRAEEEEKKAGGGTTPTTPPATPPPTPPPTPSSGSGKKKSDELKEKYKEKKQIILTQFLGEKEALHFSSLNNARTQRDIAESDQMEVGYYLETCRGRIDKKKSSKCLWRRKSAYIDDKIDEGGRSTVLLENVTRFEMRYLGPDYEAEYTDTWKSSEAESSDDRQKNKFPFAVEITLAIQDKTRKKEKPLVMTIVAPLRFANNKTTENPETDPLKDPKKGP